MSLLSKLPIRAVRSAVPITSFAKRSYTSQTAHRAGLDLSRKPREALNKQETHEAILQLYRKICRLMPHVLKSYELEGEDAYYRAVANVRLQFEHHRKLNNHILIESLRHKAEMEIEETLLLYKTKSHAAAILFVEPQLSSILRANEQQEQNDGRHGVNGPSNFMQAFLSGTA